jgi:hypothetical protein
MSRVSPWVGYFVALGTLATLLIWVASGTPGEVDDHPAELSNQVSPQLLADAKPSLWTEPLRPRFQKEEPKADPVTGYVYERRSLDDMGLGPTSSESLRSLISDDWHALLEIGRSDDNSIRYAVVDLSTHKVTSFVAMGARRVPTADGSFVLVEQDRVWAYRPGWSAFREVPNSRLQIDQAYSRAVDNGASQTRTDGHNLILALQSDGTSSAQEENTAAPRVSSAVLNVPLEEPAR